MKYRTFFINRRPRRPAKGTQGKILGTIPNFFHCACGDVFRNLTVDNELGRIFIEHSSRGELAPDDATIRLWRQSIDNNTRMGRFSPGAGRAHSRWHSRRNRNQAEMLTDALDVRAVFTLTCTPTGRSSCNGCSVEHCAENRLDDANLQCHSLPPRSLRKRRGPSLDFMDRNWFAPSIPRKLRLMFCVICCE